MDTGKGSKLFVLPIVLAQCQLSRNQLNNFEFCSQSSLSINRNNNKKTYIV
jgi:hypothetical protein